MYAMHVTIGTRGSENICRRPQRGVCHMTLNSKILRTTTTCRCTSPATRSLESIPQGPTFDLGKNDDPNDLTFYVSPMRFE